MEKRTPFTEKPIHSQANRRHAANAYVEAARMADGSQGIGIFFGAWLAVLTRDEATRIATMLVDQITTTPKEKP